MHPHIKALLRWPVQVSTIRLCHLRSLGQTPPNHQNGQFEPLIIQLFKVGNALEVLYQVDYPSALRWSIFHCSSPIPQPPNHARQGTKKFVAPACGCRLPMKKCRRKLIQDDPRFLYAPGNHAFVIPTPLSVSTGTTRTNPALPELLFHFIEIHLATKCNQIRKRSLTIFPIICLLFQSIQVREM